MFETPTPSSVPFENISKGTSTSHFVEKLVLFFEKYLPSFPIEKKVPRSENENFITQQLCLHLQRKCRFNDENISYPFYFTPQNIQRKKIKSGNDKSVDIGVRINTLGNDMEIIYCLEAKKLPTDRIKGKREKEYVCGKGGAIARFKNEDHGRDDTGNLLMRNGIVAYITDGTFTAWHLKINAWVTEIGWGQNECLNEEYLAKIGKLTSKHLSSSGVLTQLDHFWVMIED